MSLRLERNELPVNNFDDVISGLRIAIDEIFETSQQPDYRRCMAMDSLREARQFFKWAVEYEDKGLGQVGAVLRAEGWQAFKAYVVICDRHAHKGCRFCSLQRRAEFLEPT